MSARDKVIELIKSDDPFAALYGMSPLEFRHMLSLALKEQHQITRHACAEEVLKARALQGDLVGACINTQATNDLVGLLNRKAGANG